MTGEQLINDVKAIAEANLTFLDRNVKMLNRTQLQWSANDRTWSIEEVLAHMNGLANFYHPVFSKKIATTRFRKPTQNFISSPLGRASWRSMKLGNAQNVKRAFNSAYDYNPRLNQKLLSENIYQTFVDSLHQLITIFESAKSINIRKAKVSVSISKLIKFRIGDAFLFLSYHNERHIEQINKILQHPQFPKA